MTSINATNLRKNLFDYLESAAKYNDIVSVNTKHGNVIILSEEEYNGMVETLYLSSIPNMKEKLMEGLQEKIEDCEEFQW